MVVSVITLAIVSVIIVFCLGYFTREWQIQRTLIMEERLPDTGGTIWFLNRNTNKFELASFEREGSSYHITTLRYEKFTTEVVGSDRWKPVL